MKCPICSKERISPPPQTLTTPPVVECGECGWKGQVSEVDL